jgi:two-component system OmpR family response regulator
MNKLTRILHVEDDHCIQAVAKVALETVGGFKVLTCSSGREALEQVQAFAPDLILLDVMMPDMDGPDTLKQLANYIDLNHIPVVFMTAKVQLKEIAFYRSLGACDVIVKPFDPMLLAGQIEKIWEASQ